jgi:hypothetical protein
LEIYLANAFGSTFAFLTTHKANQKNAKELPSQCTKTLQQWTDNNTTEKKHEPVTGVTVAQLHFQEKNPL